MRRCKKKKNNEKVKEREREREREKERERERENKKRWTKNDGGPHPPISLPPLKSIKKIK